MTSMLSCVVATLALGADLDMKGLPFGIPPAPEDAVIARVAPPHCLFYVNWAGTAAPDPASKSETEKMLAEPEVQGLVNALTKAFIAYQRRQDEAGKRSLGKVSASPGTAASTLTAPKREFSLSNEDSSDILGELVTHPTAIFVEDAKIPSPKPAVNEPAAIDWSNAEIHAGMVVSLGPDASRLRQKFLALLKQAHSSGSDAKLERIKIAGKTWYRIKPTKPGDKNLTTFGFHGRYFVAGVGNGAVEDILARWNRSVPGWYKKALAQTKVPRRTGIIYLNLKEVREKLLAAVPDKKEAAAIAAIVDLYGLNNVNSLVSTTGLEDDSMIGRTMLAVDGKPHGLLELLGDRPLTAKDIEPVPDNALLAFVVRVDLDAHFQRAACRWRGSQRARSRHAQGYQRPCHRDAGNAQE